MTDPLIINGKCNAIDPTAKTFTMREVDGTETPFKWTEPLDMIMRKWKAGYYLTVEYDSDSHLVKNVKYWQEGKDKFPRPEKGNRGNWQPRNDKAIMLQVCYKEACETARVHLLQLSEPFEETECERVMDWAVARAIKDAKALIKEAE